MEILKHPLHVAVQLAVFAVLHKRGSEELKLVISGSFLMQYELVLYLILTLIYTSWSQSDFFTCQHSSQILDDSMSSWKDDGVEAVDVQLGQVLHLRHSLSVTEAGCLHHHIPVGMDRIHHKVHPRNHRQSQNAHCTHLLGLPVLSRGRLLSHVVNHVHLLLIWSKHLEAGAVTAQVVHGAEDERGALPSARVNSVMCIS